MKNGERIPFRDIRTQTSDGFAKQHKANTIQTEWGTEHA